MKWSVMKGYSYFFMYKCCCEDFFCESVKELVGIKNELFMRIIYFSEISISYLMMLLL